MRLGRDRLSQRVACHNVLAMAIAGLPGSRLYPGSWSEWIAAPERPIARG
jgi:Rhodanese-related sulfurtransferase